MRFSLFMIGVLCLVSVPLAAQGPTIFYLDFDDASDGVYSEGNEYLPSASEVSLPSAAGVGEATFTFRNNSGDGPEIGPAPGGLSGTRQGGKVLLTDSGSGQDEGLLLTVDNGLAKQDLTMEAVWYTDDPSGGSNNVGIQSIMGDEWPLGEASQFFMRTVGANRFDYWTDRGDSAGEKVEVSGTPVNASGVWYHDVLVFDYNDTNPANSEVIAYRDSILQGTSTYDASTASVAIFGTAFNGNRTFSFGVHNSLDAGLTDHRGLSGGLDAVAISLGALTPAEFVLPAGNVIAAATPVSVTEVYEGFYAAKMTFTESWSPGMDVGLDREDDPPRLPEDSYLPVVGGNTISFSIYARNGRTGTNDSFLVRAAYYDSGGWIGDSTDYIFTAQDIWKEFGGVYNVPSGATAANFAIRMYTSGGGSVVFDDISMTDVTASSPLPLTNGGFEYWPGSASIAPSDWRFFNANAPNSTIERLGINPGTTTGVDSGWENYR